MVEVAILGAGRVGTTLGAGLAAAGHAITYAVRDPARYGSLAGERTGVAPVRQAVAAARVVLLATPWSSTEAALAGAGDLTGKVLLDATNPLGPRLELTHAHHDSGGEQVARWAPGAKVVKVFNTVGTEGMANPRFGQARAAMFLCGDDAEACALAAGLAAELGFEPVRVGGLSQARVLEPVALLWIQLAMMLGQGRESAFGLLRRTP